MFMCLKEQNKLVQRIIQKIWSAPLVAVQMVSMLAYAHTEACTRAYPFLLWCCMAKPSAQLCCQLHSSAASSIQHLSSNFCRSTDNVPPYVSKIHSSMLSEIIMQFRFHFVFIPEIDFDIRQWKLLQCQALKPFFKKKSTYVDLLSCTQSIDPKLQHLYYLIYLYLLQH